MNPFATPTAIEIEGRVPADPFKDWRSVYEADKRRGRVNAVQIVPKADTKETANVNLGGDEPNLDQRGAYYKNLNHAVHGLLRWYPPVFLRSSGWRWYTPPAFMRWWVGTVRAVRGG
jgi:hypothetical protein